MKREERREIIRKEISRSVTHDFADNLADRIIDALEEPEQPKFRYNEIVWYRDYSARPVGGHFRAHLFSELTNDERKTAVKIGTKELAATIGARIEGAKWWSIDADGLMEWWREEPAWCDGKAPGDLQGWIYGGMVEALRTNIRQEPEKGEL